MSAGKYYDPWGQVGKAGNQALLSYLTTRPDPNKDELIKADIASKNAAVRKDNLEADSEASRIAATSAMAKLFGQVVAPVVQHSIAPAPSEDFVGAMPQVTSSLAPTPEMMNERYTAIQPEILKNAMQYASKNPGQAGDVFNAFTSNMGGNPAQITNSMMGSGKSYNDTPVGAQYKIAHDPSSIGGATGALIHEHMRTTGSDFPTALYAVQTGNRQNTQMDANGNVIPLPGAVNSKVQFDQGIKRGQIDVEREKNYAKANSNLQAIKQQASIVNDNIDEALKTISPWSTGYGSFLANLPNTEAGKLDNYLTTIKANLGFDKLQSMRENSPTGGALGQVSDFENKLLQAVNGALDPKQADTLVENLKKIKTLYPQVIKERESAFNHDYGNASTMGNQSNNSPQEQFRVTSEVPTDANTPPVMNDQNIRRNAGQGDTQHNVQKWGRDANGNPVMIGG